MSFGGAVAAILFDGSAVFDDVVGVSGFVAQEAGEGLVVRVVPGERVGVLGEDAGFDFGVGGSGAS